jgi:hypothetical protein
MLVAFIVAMGLCATGAVADGNNLDTTRQEAPKNKTSKKTKKKVKTSKAHNHKFHADHKVAAVEEPPPPPAPTPEPPPVVAPPAPVKVVEKDDSDFYGGFGLGSFRLDIVAQNINGVGGARGIRNTEFGGYVNVGYNFNRNIAVELRVGGIDGGRVPQDAGPQFGAAPGAIPFAFGTDTDAFYSGFLKGTYPIGDGFGVFGLIGATHYNVDLAADIGVLRYREDFNDGDISFGGGFEGRIREDITLGAEYVRYIDDADGGVAVELDSLVGRVQFLF